MIETLKRIFKAISDEYSLPSLEYTGKIDLFELRSILMDIDPECPIYFSDGIYNLCTLEDVKRFIIWDKTNLTKFHEEIFDCDDYAWRLMGNMKVLNWSSIPFGVVWTDRHALNCFIDDTKTFYFIEPQLDLIQTKLETWQGTKLRFISI